jgi:D-alanyl-D-alanine dipeptidase
MLIRVTAAVGACVIVGNITAFAADLPRGFVYLANVAPAIRQDIRYSGSHNFVGRPISGYRAAECVLTEKAARALDKVQRELALKKLSLVVWDCYRPTRAVADFMKWTTMADDTRMKEEFYPRTNKTKLFSLGYLATRSAHSRGSTVDLGIVPADASSPPAFDPAARLEPCTSPKGKRFEDGTIDLGTGYDCLDALASTLNPEIGRKALANRVLLRDLMTSNGFRPYSREWWHFELIDEPFPQQTFDFPIVARGSLRTARREKDPAFAQAWASFKTAVLERDSAAVAHITRFPFRRVLEDLDQVAFVADFENIFNGSITACVASGVPEPTPESIENGHIISCKQSRSDMILVFKMTDGMWRFTDIMTRPE